MAETPPSADRQVKTPLIELINRRREELIREAEGGKFFGIKEIKMVPEVYQRSKKLAERLINVVQECELPSPVENFIEGHLDEFLGVHRSYSKSHYLELDTRAHPEKADSRLLCLTISSTYEDRSDLYCTKLAMDAAEVGFKFQGSFTGGYAGQSASLYVTEAGVKKG